MGQHDRLWADVGRIERGYGYTAPELMRFKLAQVGAALDRITAIVAELDRRGEEV